MKPFGLPRSTYAETHVEIERKTSEIASEKILHLVATNERITISELAEAINVTTRFIERNIKKLQPEGRLRRVGPDKGGCWEMGDNFL